VPDDDDLRDVLAAVSYYVRRPQPARMREVLPPHRAACPQENAFPAWVLRALGSGPRAVELRRFGRSLRRRADDHGIALLIRGDHGWPTQAAVRALPCLWVRGDTDLAARLAQAVTITGARACTKPGRQATAGVVGPLAAAGWTVVTGLSPGIDAVAAAAAFAARRVPPILVSPAGLDHPAGATLQKLAEQAELRSALISPFPPGCEPNRRRWAFRDALLGTLGAASILLEAAATSGALRTARAARNAGRPAFAVTGPAASTWAGCRALIDDGIVHPVTSAAAVLNALRLAAAQRNPDPAAAASRPGASDGGAALVPPACLVPQPAREDGQQR
jgi:DNA processing protein